MLNVDLVALVSQSKIAYLEIKAVPVEPLNGACVHSHTETGQSWLRGSQRRVLSVGVGLSGNHFSLG